MYQKGETVQLRSDNPYNKDTAFDQWVAYEEGKVDQHNADGASISVEKITAALESLPCNLQMKYFDKAPEAARHIHTRLTTEQYAPD